MTNLTVLFEESVKRHWSAPALSDYQVRTKTYGELAQDIARLHLMWQAMGLQQGDKVAINAKSSVHWSEVFLAALTGGYVSVQLYNAFLPADVQQLVNHSDSKILYTEKKSFASMAFDEMPNVVAIFDTDTLELLAATDEARRAYEQADALLAAAYPPRESVETASMVRLPTCRDNTSDRTSFSATDVHFHHRDLDEVCAIMYTSGSTGNPKGVMLTARNFSWNVEAFQKHIPYCAGDNYVSILPYAHIFGLTCDLITPMCTGMHTIILGRLPIPSVVVEIMQAYSPKIFFAVPLVLAKMVEHVVGGRPSDDCQIAGAERPLSLKDRASRCQTDNAARSETVEQQSEQYYRMLREKVMAALGGKIEVFATGGAAIPPAIEQLLAFRIGMPFITGYGMSECAPLLSLGHVGRYKAKSCGETIESLQVRIASPDPEHIPGEFQVKGECVFAGYYKNPEATAEAFTEDGWFRTGDLGTLDQDSTLFLVGRCKNMLLSTNGQNIYPEEIEVLLNSLPGVQESVVVQREHLLHAIIVPKEEERTHPAPPYEGKEISAVSAGGDACAPGRLNALMEENLQNLNSRLPQYAQVKTFELRFEPFAKTPKGSIKRYLV